jgi:hypothetical protein
MTINFNAPYNRENWITFFRQQFLPQDYSNITEKTETEFKPKYIGKDVLYLGNSETLKLKVYEMHHDSENDPRIGLSRDAFKFIEHQKVKNALILFISQNSENYRLSLITRELKLEGKKVTKEFTNPKRYSYFMGPDVKKHTIEEFLVKKGRVKDEEDLKSRFSVEIVNKEFYNNIAKLFTELVGGVRKIGRQTKEFEPLLKLPDTTDHTLMQEFAVRLIGRIVFCWFLKKKKSENGISLIPEEVLSVKAIKDNYYHTVLEPLFFEVMNTKIEERKESISKNEFFKNIPFLNGGLFDPNLHQDYYKYSPMEKVYKPAYDLKIPDDWFVKLFSVLELYNFTIDENTSIDIDLSVDPEMLGRIFENLLAEINPETMATARKATGSYYTPRPIVEYMVDESLIQYLLTNLESCLSEEALQSKSHEESQSVLEQKIRNLLDYTIEENELTKEESLKVIDALDKIKILDPACGSGAFPMGILQKMLLIRQKVDPESIEWVMKQLEMIPDQLVRKTFEDKLMDENWDYKYKMSAILHSIYGVDIQTIAVELSKLRFFLTLMVDETVNDEKPNRGINELPNLSFKFVAANTLIGLPEAEKDEQIGFFDFDSILEPMMKKLEILREQFFYASGKEKAEIEKEFKQTQTEIAQFLSKNRSTNKRAVALTNWNPFADKSSDWFNSKWMFGIEDGFDIVIANPPYGAKIRNNLLQNIRKHIIDTNNSNSAALFIDFGKNKYINSNGILSYIVPKSLLYSQRWFTLVRALIDKTVSLVDVEKAFDNVLLEQVVFIFNNKFSNYQYEATKFINNSFVNSININNDQALNLQAWICDIKLIELEIFNNHFKNDVVYMREISNTKRGIGIQKYLKSSGDYSVIGGKNIAKYIVSGNKGYISSEIIKKSYSKFSFMLQKKIISQDLIAHVQNPFPHIIIMSVLDHEGNIFSVDTVQNTIIMNNNFSEEYILSLLNSKLICWFVYRFIYCSAIRTMHFDKYYIGKIPIKKESEDMQKPFIKLVDQILIDKKSGKDTQHLEAKIDLMVYKLYELTYEEVKIVDENADKVLASFGLSKADYERMSVSGFANLRPDKEEISKT